MKKIYIVIILLLIHKICFSAISASCVWECRATATAGNLNGGGFVSGGGGTDYSLQDSAEDNGTDLACSDGDATSPVVSSATHNFVAADVGNIIHITAGTGWTVGWYEIISVESNNATLDRACGNDGSISSGTWYEGGAISLASTLDDEFFEQMVAGQTCWIKAGTYTQTENVSLTADGTSSLMINVKGYNLNRGDNPTGTNRPLITAGAYAFAFDDYWKVKNFRITGTASNFTRCDSNSKMKNCYILNDSGTADRYAIGTAGGRIMKCEVSSTNGYAIQHYGNTEIYCCYIKDSKVGIKVDGNRAVIINSSIDTCTTGIDFVANDGGIIVGNTIYNCTTGVSGTTADGILFINNIFSECTTGLNWSNVYDNIIFDNNCLNNSTNLTNVTEGDDCVTSDPLMNNPGSGDFTVQSGSPILDTGIQIDTSIGVTGDYKINIGIDQDDNTASGGGGFGFFTAD